MESVVTLSATEKENLARILYETVNPRGNWLMVLPMEHRNWVAGAVKLYTLGVSNSN
jgi:hypothetical protein